MTFRSAFGTRFRTFLTLGVSEGTEAAYDFPRRQIFDPRRRLDISVNAVKNPDFCI